MTQLTLDVGNYYFNNAGKLVRLIAELSDDCAFRRDGYVFIDDHGQYYKPNGSAGAWFFTTLDLNREVPLDAITYEKAVEIDNRAAKYIESIMDGSLGRRIVRNTIIGANAVLAAAGFVAYRVVRSR